MRAENAETGASDRSPLASSRQVDISVFPMTLLRRNLM
jgi:hypothetical protein